MSNIFYLKEEPFEFPLTQESIKARFMNVSWDADNFEPPPEYHKVIRDIQPIDTYDKTHVLNDPVKIDGVYRQTWTVVQLSPEIIESRLFQMKQDLKTKVGEMRWIKETAGISIPTGPDSSIMVGTTIADQNRITSVITNCELAGIQTIDFKGQSGWSTLSVAVLKNIAIAIAQHVQVCFSCERTHCNAIDQLQTHSEIVSYDINAGWTVVQ